MSLEVVSSTWSSQSAKDAPSSISVISRDQIRRWGIRSLGELVGRLVPGAWVVEDGDDLILAFRGIAPDNNSKVLLLLNGHYYNTEWNNGPSSEVDLGLLEDVQRVEVINGPGGALYGSGATIAVINLITRTGEEVQGVQAGGNIGSGDYKKGDLVIGARHDEKLDYLVSMGGLTSDGYQETNGGHHISRFPTSYRFFGDIHYGQFKMMTRFTRSSRDLYNDFFVEGGPVVYTKYDTFLIDGSRDFSPRPDTRLNVNFYYDSIQTQRHDFVLGTKLRAVGEQRYGFKLTAFSTAWKKNNLVSGIEYRRDEFGADWTGDNFNFRTLIVDGQVTGIPSDPYSRRTITPYGRNEYAVFAQDTMAFSERYSLLLGIRYDRTEAPQIETPDAFTPRVAFVATPGPRTTFKLMYSTGFRQPIAVLTSPDSFAFGSGNVRTDIKHPEKMYSLEASVSHLFPGRANLSFTYFYDTLKNVHGVDPGRIPVGYFISAGRIDFTGFELVADVNLTDRAMFRGVQQHVQLGSKVNDVFHSFTTPDASNINAYPGDITKLLLDVSLGSGFSINTNLQLIWNFYGIGADRRTVRKVSYALWNANLVYRLNDRLDVVLSGYNLTDEDERVPMALFNFSDQARRNFNLALTYSF